MHALYLVFRHVLASRVHQRARAIRVFPAVLVPEPGHSHAFSLVHGTNIDGCRQHPESRVHQGTKHHHRHQDHPPGPMATGRTQDPGLGVQQNKRSNDCDGRKHVH